MKLAAAVLMIALAMSGCSSTKNAEADRNPCKLLSTLQVRQLTNGETVKKPLITSTGVSCSYAADGTGKISVLVTAQSDFKQADWDAEKNSATKNGATIEPLTGVGDEAFTYSAQNGTVQSAQARSGKTGAGVLLTGVGATSANAQLGLKEIVQALGG